MHVTETTVPYKRVKLMTYKPPATAKLDGPVKFEHISGQGEIQQMNETSAFIIAPDAPGADLTADYKVSIRADFAPETHDPLEYENREELIRVTWVPAPEDTAKNISVTLGTDADKAALNPPSKKKPVPVVLPPPAPQPSPQP